MPSLLPRVTVSGTLPSSGCSLMWKARVKVTSTRKQLTATDFATFRLRHHNSRRQNPTDNTSPSPPHPRPRLPRPPTRTEDQRLTSGRRLPGHLASSSGSRTNPLAKHQQHTFPKLQIKRSTAMVEFKNFDFNAKRGEHFVKTHSPYWKLGFDKDTAAPRAIAYLNAMATHAVKTLPRDSPWML
jgi:hypothetical protein